MPLLFFTLILLLSRQTDPPIYFINASFEGEPMDATMPVGWFGCEPHTTPDILPGPWGVYEDASDGETFVGLITRENSTWESISQRLAKPLQPENCFYFTLDLAHSKTYAGYNKPLKIRVWGSDTRCGKSQLLLETDFIRHSDWKTYEANFWAAETIHYILLEAFSQETEFSYGGNILIDNLSPVKKCKGA